MVAGRHDPHTHVPDEYVVEEIRRVLAEDQRAGVLDIGVAVAGSDVFLTGTASTAQRRRAIVAVVRELLPHRNVHDQMAVEQMSVETASMADRIEPEHLP